MKSIIIIKSHFAGVLTICVLAASLVSASHASASDRTGNRLTRMFNQEQQGWYDAEQRNGVGATRYDELVRKERGLKPVGPYDLLTVKTTKFTVRPPVEYIEPKPKSIKINDKVPQVGAEFEIDKGGYIQDWHGRDGYLAIRILTVSPDAITYIDHKGVKGIFTNNVTLDYPVETLSRYDHNFVVGQTLYKQSFSFLRRERLEKIGTIERLASKGNIWLRDDDGKLFLYDNINLMDWRGDNVIARIDPPESASVPMLCGSAFGF